MSVDTAERALAPDNLYDEFQRVKHERKLRQRDAARELGVSEAAVIASAVGRRDGLLRATRLSGPWPELFEELPFLGQLMALTRNESTVHEKVGRYEKLSHEGPMGLALGSDIDLRIFYMNWAHAYAVIEESPKGESRSLQVYDRYGDAVHKVFLRSDDELAAWFDFVERHVHTSQAPGDTFATDRPVPVVAPDADIDAEAFRVAWMAMKDTHEFFPLLRRFKVARTQALRLAPSGHALRLNNDAARLMLQEAARDGNAIMCFVGNPGMIQIHTGPVKRVEIMGPWLNVLDASFNLHMREDLIASTWVVRKPTSDGVVTSVECFDATGETMAMFFGERKPGKPELADWRALVDRLPRLAA